MLKYEIIQHLNHLCGCCLCAKRRKKTRKKIYFPHSNNSFSASGEKRRGNNVWMNILAIWAELRVVNVSVWMIISRSFMKPYTKIFKFFSHLSAKTWFFKYFCKCVKFRIYLNYFRGKSPLTSWVLMITMF